MVEKNPVGWFEIPVTDMERAMKFYNDVFGYEFEKLSLGSLDMSLFPFCDGPNAGGALVRHEFYKPSSDSGVLIYFTAMSGDLNNELSRVEPAGGKVLVEKKPVGEKHGFMGLFLDTEGNRIAVHSMK